MPRSVPADLLVPTYQNRLRTIGRELDITGYRSVTILEVDGGFIGRAVLRRDRDIDLLQFPDDEFPERMINATESRGQGERGEAASALAPTGWEDLLRAVGRWCDANHAACVVIAEASSAIIVSGETRPPDGAAGLFELVLDQDAITELLDTSFRLRGGQSPDPEGGF